MGIIYTRVCRVFSAKLFMGNMVSTARMGRKLARRKRTNMMLIILSLVFFLSWAPINIYYLVLDIGQPFQV